MIFVSLALALTTPAIPTGSALTEAIRARDATLFATIFDRCDPAALRKMVTDDFEMYHDRDGVVSRSGDAFVADYAKQCATWTKDSWRSRRALQDGTLMVYPIPGFGAIEDGWHLFYERQGDGPEKLVGRGRFTHVWALTPDGWRLSRVLSYAHAPVPDPGTSGGKP